MTLPTSFPRFYKSQPALVRLPWVGLAAGIGVVVAMVGFWLALDTQTALVAAIKSGQASQQQVAAGIALIQAQMPWAVGATIAVSGVVSVFFNRRVVRSYQAYLGGVSTPLLVRFARGLETDEEDPGHGGVATERSPAWLVLPVSLWRPA